MLRWVGRWWLGVVVELRGLAVLAKEGWTKGRRPWLALALAAAVIVVSELLHDSAISTGLWRTGSVTAALPLTTELRRLPMSLFLPTPYLPVWGACAQLLVAVGVAELVIGRWMTLGVALAGHIGSTLAARLMMEVGPGTVFGLPRILAHTLDTGPSGASVAVGACLLVAVRKDRCAAILSIALLIAALVGPGIDGSEHLVALACGLLAGGGYRWLHPRLEAGTLSTGVPAPDDVGTCQGTG